MKKLKTHEGVAAPIIHNNIDTDAIIPSVEMKLVSKKGLSDGLFAAWRYRDRIAREPDPAFVLNQAVYRNASILLSGKNFGCGSSREHAVWALNEFGIRVIIAQSFGAIFYANCIANGLLPISLNAEAIAQLSDFVEIDPQKNRIVVDLVKQSVGFKLEDSFHFDFPGTDAEMLLNGWDPIALTLQHQNEIDVFREKDKKLRPWIYL